MLRPKAGATLIFSNFSSSGIAYIEFIEFIELVDHFGYDGCQTFAAEVIRCFPYCFENCFYIGIIPRRMFPSDTGNPIIP